MALFCELTLVSNGLLCPHQFLTLKHFKHFSRLLGFIKENNTKQHQSQNKSGLKNSGNTVAWAATTTVIEGRPEVVVNFWIFWEPSNQQGLQFLLATWIADRQREVIGHSDEMTHTTVWIWTTEQCTDLTKINSFKIIFSECETKAYSTYYQDLQYYLYFNSCPIMKHIFLTVIWWKQLPKKMKTRDYKNTCNNIWKNI